MHENYAARPHPEYVVLEIGGDLGALMVYTDAAMRGSEIEISPANDDSDRSHKDVLERGEGGRIAFTAVFDRLPQGAYTLWSDGLARTRGVWITAGSVAELDWSALNPELAASLVPPGKVAREAKGEEPTSDAHDTIAPKTG